MLYLLYTDGCLRSQVLLDFDVFRACGVYRVSPFVSFVFMNVLLIIIGLMTPRLYENAVQYVAESICNHFISVPCTGIGQIPSIPADL